MEVFYEPGSTEEQIARLECDIRELELEAAKLREALVMLRRQYVRARFLSDDAVALAILKVVDDVLKSS